MRTTIDLPDELFREVKAKAALSGFKLKDLITQYVQQGLKGTSLDAPPRRQRSQLPIVRAASGHPIPGLTNSEMQRVLDEEDSLSGWSR